MSDPIKHQHWGHGELCIAWPKQLSFSTLDQFFIIKAKFSIRGHFKTILAQKGTIGSHPFDISTVAAVLLYYLLYNVTPIFYNRHAVQWQDEDFYSSDKLDEELRRVFDVCHGCRRCFNLCDSFPKLFDLIDESDSGELDTVASADFEPVVDACTLCDMCYLTNSWIQYSRCSLWWWNCCCNWRFSGR